MKMGNSLLIRLTLVIDYTMAKKLNFTVVDSITGDLLSQGFVSKNIDVYESPEQKKEREFDENLKVFRLIINYTETNNWI